MATISMDEVNAPVNNAIKSVQDRVKEFENKTFPPPAWHSFSSEIPQDTTVPSSISSFSPLQRQQAEALMDGGDNRVGYGSSGVASSFPVSSMAIPVLAGVGGVAGLMALRRLAQRKTPNVAIPQATHALADVPPASQAVGGMFGKALDFGKNYWKPLALGGAGLYFANKFLRDKE